MEEKDRNPAAVPVLVWLGQVIAGWAISQWFTHLWNKYVKKKKDETE
jgi:hypothetical protein